MKVEHMHRLANLNPFHSVIRSRPVLEGNGLLLGVKNDFHIQPTFIQDLVDSKNYQLHTIDVMANGGRAIDLQLINPNKFKHIAGAKTEPPPSDPIPISFIPRKTLIAVPEEEPLM